MASLAIAHLAAVAKDAICAYAIHCLVYTIVLVEAATQDPTLACAGKNELRHGVLVHLLHRVLAHKLWPLPAHAILHPRNDDGVADFSIPAATP